MADEGALFQGKCSMIETPEEEKVSERVAVKKNYKKSSVLDDLYDEKEKSNELKG